jgi:NADH:ubiquinone oxidoreductase subunit 6 (subunit J)
MSPLLAAVHLTELRTILPAVAAGAAAVFVLLPRPRPYPSWVGALLGAVAVLLTGATILRITGVRVEALLFYAFSLIAVVSGALLVTQHNPARAALSFAVVILSTCGLFLLLAAPFLMAATIIIYAGAIIVTFLFLLMLAQQEGRSDADLRSREPLLATLTGFILLGALVYVLQLSYETSDTVQALDEVLARTREMRDPNQTKPQEEIADYLIEPIDRLNKSRGEARSGQLVEDRFRAIRGAITDRIANANSPEQLKQALEQLEGDVLVARQQSDWLRPPAPAAGKQSALSDMSGPSANEPAENLRYDTHQGRPELPAENAAYLGRSLFTDYLLPVELGGFLLLVAVVGSVAIAQRRTPEERP